jgi:alpha-tubulin suppressor-like RCC1 family protein
MAVSRDCLKTQLQTNINAFTNSTCEDDLVAAATSLNTLSIVDISSTVTLGCDLPDLNSGNVARGTIYYVEELNTPLIAGGKAWRGLDGRTYRKDVSDVALFGWGDNRNSMLGTGNSTTLSSPVQEVTSSLAWCFVVSSDYNGYGLTYDGKLYAWGQIGYGNIWQGTTSISGTVPIRECTSATWTHVSSGGYVSHAVRNDGTLWGTGYDSNRVGVVEPSLSFYSSPIQEGCGFTNWRMTAHGYGHVRGIRTDGTLWSWGAGVYTATNSTAVRNLPTQDVTSATDWCFVVSGWEHIHALKTSGQLWGWGCNCDGRLGTNNTTVYSSPAQEVTSATNWCLVAAGSRHSAALKTNGTLWSWGLACNDGATGTNNRINYSSPVQEITSATNWCYVSAGGLTNASGTTIAIKTNNTLWGWGNNYCGQLSTNDRVCYSSPVQEFTSGTNWCFVCTTAFRGAGTLALKVIL